MDDLERAEKSNRLLKIISIAALIAVVSLAYAIGRYSSKEDVSTSVNTEQQETQSSSEPTDEEKKRINALVDNSIKFSQESAESRNKRLSDLNKSAKSKSDNQPEKDFSKEDDEKNIFEKIDDFFEYVLAYGKDEIQEQVETNDLEDDKNESETKTSSGHYHGQNPELDKMAEKLYSNTIDYLSKTPEERIKENEDFKKELENN